MLPTELQRALPGGAFARKLAAAVVLSIASFVALGCGLPVQVKSAYDRSAAFGEYRTFAMLLPNRPVPSGVDVDPFTMQRLRQLTFEHLRTRGLRPVAKEDAQLLVSVLAASEERVEVYNRGFTYAGMYGYPAGPAFATDVRTYEEGTVVIDLIDREKEAVVWRGTGVRQSTRSLDDEELREVIERILSLYPPGSEQGDK